MLALISGTGSKTCSRIIGVLPGPHDTSIQIVLSESDPLQIPPPSSGNCGTQSRVLYATPWSHDVEHSPQDPHSLQSPGLPMSEKNFVC